MLAIGEDGTVKNEPAGLFDRIVICGNGSHHRCWIEEGVVQILLEVCLLPF